MNAVRKEMLRQWTYEKAQRTKTGAMTIAHATDEMEAARQRATEPRRIWRLEEKPNRRSASMMPRRMSEVRSGVRTNIATVRTPGLYAAKRTAIGLVGAAKVVKVRRSALSSEASVQVYADMTRAKTNGDSDRGRKASRLIALEKT